MRIIRKREQRELTHFPLSRPDRVSLYTLGSTPLFFQHMDDPIIPHLSLVHQYPTLFPRIRIDRGAIRFVLSGAALMAPGLTSPGGRLPGEESDADGIPWGSVEKGKEGAELEPGEVAVIVAEGKENACLIGVLKMVTKEMKEKKKGPAMETGHYLGDGLWRMKLD